MGFHEDIMSLIRWTPQQKCCHDKEINRREMGTVSSPWNESGTFPSRRNANETRTESREHFMEDVVRWAALSRVVAAAPRRAAVVA